MKRVPVISSDVESIGFKPYASTHSGILEVEFKTGAVYQYANVPETFYREIINAHSVGATLHARVKRYPTLYPYTRVK